MKKQRLLARAIKVSRAIGLLPHVSAPGQLGATGASADAKWVRESVEGEGGLGAVVGNPAIVGEFEAAEGFGVSRRKRGREMGGRR